MEVNNMRFVFFYFLLPFVYSRQNNDMNTFSIRRLCIFGHYIYHLKQFFQIVCLIGLRLWWNNMGWYVHYRLNMGVLEFVSSPSFPWFESSDMGTIQINVILNLNIGIYLFIIYQFELEQNIKFELKQNIKFELEQKFVISLN